MNLLADILSLKYLSNKKELNLIPEMYINIFFLLFSLFVFYLFDSFYIIVKLVYYRKNA